MNFIELKLKMSCPLCNVEHRFRIYNQDEVAGVWVPNYGSCYVECSKYKQRCRVCKGNHNSRFHPCETCGQIHGQGKARCTNTPCKLCFSREHKTHQHGCIVCTLKPNQILQALERVSNVELCHTHQPCNYPYLEPEALYIYNWRQYSGLILSNMGGWTNSNKFKWLYTAKPIISSSLELEPSSIGKCTMCGIAIKKLTWHIHGKLSVCQNCRYCRYCFSPYHYTIRCRMPRIVKFWYRGKMYQLPRDLFCMINNTNPNLLRLGVILTTSRRTIKIVKN